VASVPNQEEEEVTNETPVWVGPADLVPLLVPIKNLTTYPGNPRRGQIELLKESLNRFGQVRPILVNETGVIVAGNHTYRAAVDLGWTHVAALPNTFTSEDEARAYLVADNRIPELGSYEGPQLLALLEEVETVDRWEGTGFTLDDLEDLRATHDAIAETDAQEFHGDFAVTAEELAARAQALEAGRTLSEVVLTVSAAQGVEFDRHIKILTKAYGTSGATDTVLEAVRRAAKEDA
jgi:hypothetical protein